MPFSRMLRAATLAIFNSILTGALSIRIVRFRNNPNDKFLCASTAPSKKSAQKKCRPPLAKASSKVEMTYAALRRTLGASVRIKRAAVEGTE
jgi:hypothetical protein